MNSFFENVDCPICDSHQKNTYVPGSRTDIYIKKFNFDLPHSSWAFCNGCGLLFQNPRPTNQMIENFYKKNQYFGHKKNDVERLFRVGKRKHAEKLRYALEDSLLPCPSPHLLSVDIGCGIGGGVRLMQEYGMNSIGIEPDPIIGELGRKELSIDIRTGLFQKGMLEDNSVSFFYSNHVFEHLLAPEKVVMAMTDALTKGGKVLTCIPTYAKNSSLEAYAWMNLSHNYLFTHHTLGALFEKYGFVIEKWRYETGANELWMLARYEETPSASTSCKFTSEVIQQYNAVPYRSIFYFPLRISYHAKEVWGSWKTAGIHGAMKDLWIVFRTPLADSYRVILSYLKQWKSSINKIEPIKDLN